MINLKIIKKDTTISLMNGDIEIESYKLENTVDFSRLINFLISNELSEEIDVSENLPDDLNPEEVNLCTFIIEIIEKYNSSVKEFVEFKKLKSKI